MSLKKLMQTAALAAMVIAIGSARAEATAISYSASTTGTAFFGTFPERYAFQLTFDTAVTGIVDVTVSEGPTIFSLPPGYTCVPIGGLGKCVTFDATPQSGFSSFSFYDVYIYWEFDTDTLYSNNPGNRIRLLHQVGSVWTDITSTPYCPGPVCGPFPPGFPDGGIGGTDSNFSKFAVVQTTPVPEPIPPMPSSRMM